jgi:hypothetical protein
MICKKCGASAIGEGPLGFRCAGGCGSRSYDEVESTQETTDQLTSDQLRQLFAKHCECRPLDLERTADDHAAIHDCDTGILDEIQVAMSSGIAEEAADAMARCVTRYRKEFPR